MIIFIETIIYIFSIVGIIVVISNYFDCNLTDNKQRSNSGNLTKVDIYLKNMPKDEKNKLLKKIKEDTCLYDLVDIVNIHDTFDND